MAATRKFLAELQPHKTVSGHNLTPSSKTILLQQHEGQKPHFSDSPLLLSSLAYVPWLARRQGKTRVRGEKHVLAFKYK